MSQHSSNTDTRIDQILDALRTTEPPAGLEQRVAASLAQAAEARTLTAPPFALKNGRTPTSFFAVILNAVKDPRILFAEAPLYTLAVTSLTLLLALSIALHLHHKPSTIAQSKPLPNQPITPTQPPTLSQVSNPANTQLPQTSRLSDTQVPQGFSLGSHSPTQRAGALTPAPPDPDTLALAETLAPSHPAPPMPLTPQERLLQTATQRGQPIELAELDLAREPAIRAAAQAHEKAGLQQFVRSLVSQLVTSESLVPTTHTDPQPTPTSPSTNEPSTNEPPTNGASPQ
jgi:hypothetical protein